jgi:hypothetical protein
VKILGSWRDVPVNTPQTKYSDRSPVAESPDNLIADLVKPGVAVSYHLSDGSTARASYVAGGIENVETLLQQKRE